jgi:ABC-type phosphate/phosphonate transport system substrate-binding protein
VLKDRVTLVGTPDYGVGGCPPGHYCSVVLTRRGDDRPLETMRLAANDGLSQSGWAAASAYAEARGTPFGGVLKTGSHAASAHAVADGAADIAFVDAVTWSILTRWEPALEALCVIDRTPPMPGLPYITARAEEAPRLAQALRTAIAGLSPDDRALLRLRGLVEIPAADYLAIANPPPLPAETPAML